MPIAMITGAGRGIGRATAVALAEAGYDIAALSRSAGPLEQTLAALAAHPTRCIALTADITDEAQVAEAFAACVQQLGVPDVLVNNAGNAPVGPTATFSLSDWNDCIGVNLTGAFLCAREALRIMGRGASIVNISSGAGKHGKAGWAAYCAAKSGLHGLSRALVEECKPLGIRVNTVCPGGTRTELRHSICGDEPEGTLLEPTQVADAVCFLVSERAQEIRGAELDVRKA